MKRILAFLAIVAHAHVTFAAPTPGEIMKSVEERYRNFKTYSAEGITVSDMKPAGAKVSHPMTNFFSVKLAKPDLFKVEWAQPATEQYSNEGITWGDGMGNFLMLMSKGTARAMKNRDVALGQAGSASGSASLTTPAFFFDTKSSVLKTIKNFTAEKDATIDNEDCYVLSGTAEGQKILVWITKKDYFIKQKQFVIGKAADPTDDDAKEALKQMEREATPEAIADMKARLKSMRQASSSLVGTITESYQKIAADRQLRKEDYTVAIPKGIRLQEN